jgi:nucleoside-diphosphate-sugar epimerase
MTSRCFPGALHFFGLSLRDWDYSQRKIGCEAMLKVTDKLPWTIVRPSHTVRTGLPTMMNEGDVVAHRMLAGKPVLVAGDGTAPWTLTRSADLAVPFVGLFGKPGALGEDFHITSDRAYTWNAIYETIARGLGVEADIVHVTTDTWSSFIRRGKARSWATRPGPRCSTIQRSSASRAPSPALNSSPRSLWTPSRISRNGCRQRGLRLANSIL